MHCTASGVGLDMDAQHCDDAAEPAGVQLGTAVAGPPVGRVLPTTWDGLGDVAQCHPLRGDVEGLVTDCLFESLEGRHAGAPGGGGRRSTPCCFLEDFLDNFLTAGRWRSGMTARAALKPIHRHAAARIRGR